MISKKTKRARAASCGRYKKIIEKSITRIKESTNSSPSEDTFDYSENENTPLLHITPSKKESDTNCLRPKKSLSSINSNKRKEKKKNRKNLPKRIKKKPNHSTNSKDDDYPKDEKMCDLETTIIDTDEFPFLDFIPEESESSNDLISKLKDEIKKKEQKIISQTRVIKELKEKNAFQKEEINQLHENIENKYKNHMLKKSSNIQIYGIQFFNELNKKKIIGHEVTTKIFKVTHEEEYALKTLDIDLITKTKDEDQDPDDDYDSQEEDSSKELDFEKIKVLYIEYGILSKLNHPNIIKTFGFFNGDLKNPPSILLEYCPYNLKKHIKKLSSHEMEQVIIQVCDAFRHIHKEGLIHRNLEPENILLDSNKQVKVSNFGICALHMNDDISMIGTQIKGCLEFMAPELFQRKNDYNEKVDVYSFGVLIYFIVTKGKYPVVNIADIVLGKAFPIPNTFNEITKTIIRSCISLSPEDRPSFDDLYCTIQKNKNLLV